MRFKKIASRGTGQVPRYSSDVKTPGGLPVFTIYDQGNGNYDVELAYFGREHMIRFDGRFALKNAKYCCSLWDRVLKEKK